MLASAGLDIRFESLWEGFVTPDSPPMDKKEPSSTTIEIDGSNYGKPYPPKEGASALPKPFPDYSAMTLARNSISSNTDNLPSKEMESFSEKDSAISSDIKNRSRDHQWLTAFQTLQINMYDAHKKFQKRLTESHMAFIKSSERALAELERMAGSGLEQDKTSKDFRTFDVSSFMDSAGYKLNGQTVSDDFDSDGVSDFQKADDPDNQKGTERNVALSMDEDTFRRVILEIVSEQTGYPEEVLDFKTDMESGFGIDSIKKMEILSGFQDRFPGIELHDTEALSRLYTMEEILEYVKATFKSSDVTKSGESVNSESREISKEIHRYRAAYIPAPANGVAMAGLDKTDTLYIIRDNKGVAPILSEMLNARSIHSKVVQELPKDAGAVLFLKGINELSPGKKVNDAIELNRSAFEIASRCGSHMRNKGGVFITVQDTCGDFGLSGDSGERAWSAGIAALVKTAKKEWEKASVKAIDIHCGDRKAEDIAKSILEELMAGGSESVVGLKSNDQRFRVDIRNCELNGKHRSLSDGGVVLASGGAQGITAACLLALADRFQLKFAILGRTEIVEEPEYVAGCETDAEIKKAIIEEYKRLNQKIGPAEMASISRDILACRRIRSNLQKLETRGSQVKYFAVDVRKKDEINRVVKEIHDEWGEIRMLIHAAGIISDKYIHEKPIDQFDDVFTTKVSGFRNLLSATSDDPLAHIFCFSSVVAQKGHAGQVDYAMANETLNKVCQFERKRRNGQCCVKALNWGPWEAGMVTPHLKSYFDARGYALIQVDEGGRLFVKEVETDEDNHPVEVILLRGKPEVWLMEMS